MSEKKLCIRKKIRQLAREGYSEREILEELKVSRSMVRRWSKRDNFADRSSRPHKTHQKLNSQQKILLAESGRALRWPLNELRGHLSFFYSEFMKEGRPRGIFKHQKDREYNGLSDDVYHRVFCQTGLKKLGKRNVHDPGTVAVHSIHIKWISKAGGEEEGFALIFVERHSGFANVLIHRSFTPGKVQRYLKSFCRKFEAASGHQVTKVCLVTNSDSTPTVPLKGILEDKVEDLKNTVPVNGRQIPAEYDPPSSDQKVLFVLKGKFDDLEEFRTELKTILNNYNQRPGHRSRTSRKRVESPLEKILQLRQEKKGRKPPVSQLEVRRLITFTGKNRSQPRKTKIKV